MYFTGDLAHIVTSHKPALFLAHLTVYHVEEFLTLQCYPTFFISVTRISPSVNIIFMLKSSLKYNYPLIQRFTFRVRG